MADEHGTARVLRERADAGRRVAFKTDYFKLPQAVQDALYGIAAELENAADEFDALAAREQTLRQALAAYRSALRSGEPESEQLRALARAALATDAPAPEETP